MSTQSASLQQIAALVRPARHHGWANTRSESPQLYGRGRDRQHIPLILPLVRPSIETTRVLIVDDARSTAPLQRLLHGLGYWTTQVAASGASALEMAQSFSPSMVILSLILPDMCAYDVAEQLRDRTEERRLRLIALTGDYTHIGREQARKAGFERYLAKPVNLVALQQLMRAELS
jgi:CheY-like chemotaxis protein